ncbi:hypothetical protein, partial [Rhodobacter capsulatus]|uniref:hypothetical protein n=1 Tax=Rhodobacter capsulatus TaxID=1061 RepID=UPI001C655114
MRDLDPNELTQLYSRRPGGTMQEARRFVPPGLGRGPVRQNGISSSRSMNSGLSPSAAFGRLRK